MQEIKPPQHWLRVNHVDKTLFAAGGISGCPNWQSDYMKMLAETPLTVFNPRREHIPTDTRGFRGVLHEVADGFFGNRSTKETCVERQQEATWEFQHIERSDGVSLWFPEDGPCVVSLFELGTLLYRSKSLFVGISPYYRMRKEIEIQIALAKPNIIITYSLHDLARQVVNWSIK